MKRIAVISDTHGFLPPGVFEKFKDVDVILHAGDIGNRDIIIELGTMAQTFAVYGNTDPYEIRGLAPKKRELDIEGFKIHLSHHERPEKGRFDIVIRGHTHVVENRVENNCLYLNPGSANPSRTIPQGNPTALILLLNKEEKPAAEIIIRLD